jgi:hypothetical protein
LPDALSLPPNIDEVWELFKRMEQTGWRWPPSMLLQEDGELMHWLLLIKTLDGIVKEQNKKED